VDGKPAKEALAALMDLPPGAAARCAAINSTGRLLTVAIPRP